MATIIDITNKLKNEEKFVKIGEKSYKVDASKNNMISVMADLEKSDNVETMDIAVEKLIGKAGKKEIDAMNLDFTDYKTVFIAIFAAASDISFDEAERRFQG